MRQRAVARTFASAAGGATCIGQLFPGSRVKLVGDIGGTNARLALWNDSSGSPQEEETLACADYRDLGAAIEDYLARKGGKRIDEAAVAVATPILGDRIRFTNNPWDFSVDETRDRLGLRRLLVLNDFKALALALPRLRSDELRQVGNGQSEADRPIALLGAGTGLGVSGLVPSDEGWIALEGEGGHTTFAPANARESSILGALWQRHDHVSTERLASGPGITALYWALCIVDGLVPEEPSPEEVSARAAMGDVRAGEVLEIFCQILGTAAGNLCLTLGARGGVYIGGGIVPSLGERFDRSGFRARFESKGRFSSYLAAVPTYVITARNPALRGVAQAFGEAETS